MRTPTILDARQRALGLLDRRAVDKTVCPSEVARALAAEARGDGAAGWRDLMPLVHSAIDELVDDGLIRLSWKGRPLDRRAGPYRFRKPTRAALD